MLPLEALPCGVACRDTSFHGRDDERQEPRTPPLRCSPRVKKKTAAKLKQRGGRSRSSSRDASSSDESPMKVSASGKAIVRKRRKEVAAIAAAAASSDESSGNDFARRRLEAHKKSKKKASAKARNSSKMLKRSKTSVVPHGKNYSQAELLHYFSLMETTKPIGKAEWEHVVKEHEKTFPGKGCRSLRHRFNEKSRNKIPTGNPECPPEVKATKRVLRLCREKADIFTVCSDFDSHMFSSGEDDVPSVVEAEVEVVSVQSDGDGDDGKRGGDAGGGVAKGSEPGKGRAKAKT